MQRSSPLYGGPSVTAPPLLAPLSNAEQQQQQQHQHYETMTHQQNQLGSPPHGRGTLKRKLPIVELDSARYSAPYSPVTDATGGGSGNGGPLLKTKPRKESASTSGGCSSGVELHEFPAFGQAFQGVSGIGQFYVIGPNDTNNNAANALTLAGDGQQHLHAHGQDHPDHHHQLATYIYDVPTVTEQHVDDATQVIPITEHHLVSTVPVSDVVHHTNGIVLTDISSSTWTSTAELLDLDRKSTAPTLPTNVHQHRYSIISTEHQHHHHHQQQQQQQHSQHQQSHHQNHQSHHQHQHHGHQHHQQQQCLVTTHHQQHHQHHHHQQQHHHTSHQSSVQQLHMHHQPTPQQQQQQQSPSCPSSPRLPATPTTVSSPSHNVPTSQHHSNNQPPVGHQYVPQQYAAGDAGSPYGSTGNNQSNTPGGASWPNPTAQTDATTEVASSPRMEPASGGAPVTNGKVTLASQTPDTPEDCKNLSWLLNFKLDDIPNLSPRSNRKQRSKSNAAGGGQSQSAADGSTGGNGSLGSDHGAVAIEEGDLNVGENVTIESSTGKSPKKPPFTYTELIEYALEEQGDLTVAAIYQWISDHFPYYKSHDDRWKNSVRHNLSINPHFRKGRKSSHGSGHLWTISSRNSEDNFLAWEHKKQRFEWFFKMEANARVRELGTTDSMTDDEVAAATASLAQYAPKSPTAGPGSPVCQTLEAINPAASEPNHHLPVQTTLQQQQQQQQHHHHHQHHHQQQQHAHQQGPQQIATTYQHTQTLYADIITSAQFEVTATSEEIKHAEEDTLNGFRRGTEIQIVRPTQTIQTYEMLDTEYSIADYLNPVPKEEIVQECGLRSVALDPAELGINIPSATGQDEDILFDDFNLNYFGNNIMT
ncbi:transcription factor mef2A-like [Anopheles ziemanni]|uniref:transcription factor mef2A-like n=1 Tax=Anopheles coustani TaxID=139045 RepID=UPI0026592B22|nr:transcription factor mef2A-like [Anopheles coustani]XP_058176119.1 transcription factor mef2A-like [Anopheles ziemanni]